MAYKDKSKTRSKQKGGKAEKQETDKQKSRKDRKGRMAERKNRKEQKKQKSGKCMNEYVGAPFSSHSSPGGISEGCSSTVRQIITLSAVQADGQANEGDPATSVLFGEE